MEWGHTKQKEDIILLGGAVMFFSAAAIVPNHALFPDFSR